MISRITNNLNAAGAQISPIKVPRKNPSFQGLGATVASKAPAIQDMVEKIGKLAAEKLKMASDFTETKITPFAKEKTGEFCKFADEYIQGAKKIFLEILDKISTFLKK